MPPDPEFFPLESISVDSPRLAWIKRHGIVTLYSNPPGCEACWYAGFQDWHPGKRGGAFFANETARMGCERVGIGDNEDEALFNLLESHYARSRGIKAWTLE